MIQEHSKAVGLSALAGVGLPEFFDLFTVCCALAGVFLVSARLPATNSIAASIARLLATVFLSVVFAAVIEQRLGGGAVTRAAAAGIIGLVFHAVLSAGLQAIPALFDNLMTRAGFGKSDPTK